MRKLHDFEVVRVAAHATVKCSTVRKYFKQPENMRPSTKERVLMALRELGLAEEPAKANQGGE